MKNALRAVVWAGLVGVVWLAMLGGCQERGLWPELRQGGVEAAALYPEEPESAAEGQVRKQLETARGDFVFEQQGLEKVLGTIADAQKLNVLVNWKALEGGAIDKNTPITVKLHNVALKAGLEQVLAQAGGASGSLGYTVDDGMVVVSTKDDLNSKYLDVRVYPIGDLVATAPEAFLKLMPPVPAHPAAIDLQRMTASRTVVGPPAEDGLAAPQDEAIKDLIATIENAITPDAWRDNGGSIGSIKELNGQLIINHTKEAHVKIADLLRRLRAKAMRRIAVDAELVAVDAKTMRALDLANMPRTLTQRQAETVQRVIAASAANRVVAGVRLALREGQPLTMESGQTQRVATGVEVTETAGTTQPTTQAATTTHTATREDVDTGLTLTVAASRTEGDAIALFTGVLLGRFEGVAGAAAGNVGQDGYLIDRPGWSHAGFATTVVLPAGKWALLGGVPVAESLQGKAGRDEARFLFLLVRPMAEAGPGAATQAGR